jgi:hypothetical protein
MKTSKKCDDDTESNFTVGVPKMFPTVARTAGLSAELLKGSTSKVTPLNKKKVLLGNS